MREGETTKYQSHPYVYHVDGSVCGITLCDGEAVWEENKEEEERLKLTEAGGASS